MRSVTSLCFSMSLILIFTGCIEEIDGAKKDAAQDAAQDEIRSFLDGYDEEESEKVSNSEAINKNYIDDTEVTANTALGSARIGGEIALDALSNRSRAKMARTRRFTPNSRAIEQLTTDSFKVSFIDGTGNKVDVDMSQLTVHIHQPDNENPQFIIEGVSDGINYIIDIVVTLEGSVLDLKTLAFVPPGEDKSEKATVDPISTVIAKAVQEKVQNGFFETNGDTFSQTYIRDLHETMVAIIDEVIESNPEVNLATFEAAINSPEGVNSLVGKLLSVQAIDDGLNKLENAAVADSFAVPLTVSDPVVAQRIINELINQGTKEGKEGAPLFVINFFADRYVADDRKSVEQLMNAIFSDIQIDASSTDLSQYSTSGALEGFILQLFTIYARVDAIADLENKNQLSTAETYELSFLHQSLSNIPNQLLGLFPAELRDQWLTVSGNSQFTVPQTFGLIFYILNVYFKDLTTSKMVNGQLEESSGVGFDPENLLLLYGYDPSNTEQQAQYANIGVSWLDLHPGRIWVADANGGQGSELNILSLFTCIDTYPIENYTINDVSLSYPKQDGTNGSIMLVPQSQLQTQLQANDPNYTAPTDTSENPCYTLDPWAESEILAFSGNPEYGDASQGFINYDIIWRDLLASGTVITNFISGEYALEISYTQLNVSGVQTLNARFDKRVITGLENLYPQFTSPNGLPPFPDPNASSAEHDAYTLALNSFEVTTFANADSVFFSWLAPALLSQTPLPEDVIAVYHLNVGREVCQFNEQLQYQECQWIPVFSSQENDNRIFNTQYEVPDSAKANLLPLALSDSPYQANLNIEFVDANTGEFLGAGGSAQAPFRIGEVLNLDNSFTLEGRVFNAPDNNFINPQTNQPYPISQYKVAAIKESCFEDISATAETYSYTDEFGNEITDSYFPWICNIETLGVSPLTATADDYSYSLSPTLRQMMNSGQDSWIDIRLFIDINNDDLLQADNQDGNSPGEPMFGSLDFVNFNSWGGVLRISRETCDENQQNCVYSETVISPSTLYRGPDFNVNPVFDNIDIDATFTLTGSVFNAPDGNFINPQTGQPFPLGAYKVAAIKESCFEDSNAPAETATYTDEFGNEITDTVFPWVCNTQILDISDLTISNDGHSYSLSPTFGQVLNNDPSSWIDIRLFIDMNGDGLIEEPTLENNYQGEPMFWSQQYVYFSYMDGELRLTQEQCDIDGLNCIYSETAINPDTSYPGPNFEVTPQFNDNPDQIDLFTSSFSTNGSVIGTVFQWGFNGTLTSADVAGFNLILLEFNDLTSDPVAALIAEVATNLNQVTMNDLLIGNTGVTNISAQVILQDNIDSGGNLQEITGANLLDNKIYGWFIEPLDSNGNVIGESDFRFLQ